jgi:RNA polymerase sigma-70 factor (ECF subfamily)
VPVSARELEPVAGGAAPADRASDSARLRRVLDGHYDLVWRTVRYFGVPDAGAEDAAQQVFCVLALRIADVTPGTERAFVLTTAVRVASEARRKARRCPAAGADDVDEIAAPLPSPEELVDRNRARRALQEVLDAMPMDLRVVFVLFEIEELTLVEIAELVGIKLGTATSRLRRARESFQGIVRRRQAAEQHQGRGERGGRK